MTKKLTLALNSRDGTAPSDVKDIGKVWKKSLQQGVIDPSYSYYKGVLAILYCEDDLTSTLSRTIPGYTFVTIEGVNFSVLTAWLAQKSFPRRFSLTFLDTYAGDGALTALKSMVTLYSGSNEFDTDHAIMHHDRIMSQLHALANPESDPVTVSLLSPEFRSDLTKYTGITENVAAMGNDETGADIGRVAITKPTVSPVPIATVSMSGVVTNNLGVQIAQRSKTDAIDASTIKKNVDSISSTRPAIAPDVRVDKKIPALTANGLAEVGRNSDQSEKNPMVTVKKKDNDWSGFLTVGTIITSIVTGVIANEIQDRKNSRKKSDLPRHDDVTSSVDPGFVTGRRKNPFVRYFPNGYKILG